MNTDTTREVPITVAQCALIFIDVQNYATHPDGSEFKSLPGPEKAKLSYYFKRLESVALPNMQRVLTACRSAGVEVIYAVIENLTADGRDRSLDYKISGISVARGSWDARVCDAIAPEEDEIILRKNSSSVFISTNIDYLKSS
jgi:ureidoacrylate peracid hydrolase